MSILEYMKQQIALDIGFWNDHWLFGLLLIVAFPCIIFALKVWESKKG